MPTVFLATEFQFISDWGFIIFCILTLINTVVIVMLLRKISYLEDQVKKNTLFRRSKLETINSISVNAGDNINDLTKRVKRLESQSQENGIRLMPPTPLTPTAEPEKSVEINLSLPKKTQRVEFFMSTPNSDGTFDGTQKSDSFKPTISLYKFTLESINATNASFEFYSDDFGIKDALNNPKRFIEPVCYEVNDAFVGSKKIIMQKNGLAVKQGEQWKVEKNNKAQIKYE